MSDTAVHISRPGRQIDLLGSPPSTPQFWSEPSGRDLVFSTLVDWTPTVTGSCFPGWWKATSTTHGAHTTRTERVLALIDRVVAATSDRGGGRSGEAGARELALGAVESLRRWLGLTDEQVAALVGIAPRSIPNWRNKGHQPYPATVRRLFEIHNLVAALVRRLGLHEAAVWLAQPVEGASRLDRLTGDGFNSVVSDAAPLLFPQPRRRYTEDDWEDAGEMQSPAPDPGIFQGRARSARRRRPQA